MQNKDKARAAKVFCNSAALIVLCASSVCVLLCYLAVYPLKSIGFV